MSSYKPPTSRAGNIVAAALLLGGAVLLYPSCSAPATPVDPCADDVVLSLAADNFVKKHLDNPRTAEFQGFGTVERKDGQITYLAYVDAQNGFGVVKRMYFKVWMTCANGQVNVLRHKFEME